LPSPDYWTFYKQQVISDQNPPSGSLDIVVCGDNRAQDFYALCVGDFNRSFIPSSESRDSEFISSLSLIHDGDLIIEKGSVVELPIEVTSDVEIGAFSLILDIPTHMVNVENVFIMDGIDPSVPGRLDWNMDGNVLRIGWNSIEPLSFEAFSTLITLELTTTYEFTTENTLAINLVNDPLNELVDSRYETIDNAVLRTYYVTPQSTGLNDLDDAAMSIDLSCRPNPFNESTMLNYTLPARGEVILELVNKYGSRVERYVAGIQDKGEYSVRIDGVNLNPGIYTAILYYNSGGNMMKKSVKLVRGL
jgi:hypothetical protein